MLKWNGTWHCQSFTEKIMELSLCCSSAIIQSQECRKCQSNRKKKDKCLGCVCSEAGDGRPAGVRLQHSLLLLRSWSGFVSQRKHERKQCQVIKREGVTATFICTGQFKGAACSFFLKTSINHRHDVESFCYCSCSDYISHKPSSV